MSLTVEKCLQAWTNSLKQMKAKADIVFFGDSLTYYGDFSKVFPDKVVCNLGLRGDTILGMIGRVEQVKILEPQTIFLMTGINDVATGSHDDFREKYSLLLQQLISILPGTTIVVQSMLPVNNLQYKFSCDNKQIELRNKVIEQLSHESGLQYLDLFSLYETNGYMMAEMTNDGIHLKTAAYQKWYSMMLSLYK